MPHPFMFHIEGDNQNDAALFAAVETAFKLRGPQWEAVKSVAVIDFPEQADRVWFPPHDKESIKSVPTLVLCPYLQAGAETNLIPWTMEESCRFVQRWLTEKAEYPKDRPDTDGSVFAGYCVFLPVWGEFYQLEENKKLFDLRSIILAVQPAWCVYGK